MRNGQKEGVRDQKHLVKHHLRSLRDLELHLKPALVIADTVILANAVILSSGGWHGDPVCRS